MHSSSWHAPWSNMGNPLKHVSESLKNQEKSSPTNKIFCKSSGSWFYRKRRRLPKKSNFERNLVKEKNTFQPRSWRLQVGKLLRLREQLDFHFQRREVNINTKVCFRFPTYFTFWFSSLSETTSISWSYFFKHQLWKGPLKAKLLRWLIACGREKKRAILATWVCFC